MLKKVKWLCLLLALAAVFAVGIAGSMAFLTTNSNQVIGTFEPAQMSCEVQESFIQNASGTYEKSDVRIKNTSDAPAYIRVKLLPYWYGKEGGSIVAKAAWTPSFTPENGWILGEDGFYYYTVPVNPEECTGVLIPSLTMGMDSITSYRQALEIIASCVQAEPAEAVEAWSNNLFTVTNGELIKKTQSN